MAKKKEELSAMEREIAETEAALDAEALTQGQELEEEATEEEPEKQEVAEETEEVVEEPAEEAAEEPEGKPGKERSMVKAVDSERHRRKEAEEKYNLLAEQMRQMQQIQQMQQPKQEAPAVDEMPDPLVDAAGFQAWMGRRDAAAAAPVQQMQAHHQQREVMENLRGFAASSEATFTAEHPDYQDALSHAREMKHKEFMSYKYSPEQARELVRFTEAQISALARERGVNPAQMVWDYAQITGFKGGKKASPAAKMEKLATTERKTRSAATASGAARDEEETSFDDLAAKSQKELNAMSDDDINRILKPA